MLTSEQMRQMQSALALQKQGRFADALGLCNKIMREAPEDFDCLHLSAILHFQEGSLNAAIECFQRCARLRPDLSQAHYNLAVALSTAGDYDQAAQSYERALKIEPQHSGARNNYAACLLSTGRFSEALHQYNQLIALRPDLADAYNNRGMVLEHLIRLDEALRDYDKAISLRSNFAEAFVNRGNVLDALGRPDDALASYGKALEFKPDLADAYSNIANIHSLRGAHNDAIKAFDRVISLNADDSEARSKRLYAKMHLCDWSDFDADCSELISRIRRGSSVSPFAVLAISDSPNDQIECARSFVRAKCPPLAQSTWRGEIYSHDRIRIAYLSADFREHATARSLVGLFEQHNKSRFEVTAISFGSNRSSPMRHRMEAALEHFIDVQDKSDQEIAATIGKLEIDIAVDLMGYTQNARPWIFARRPAPVQVSYLGYLGTMGAKFIDYIIADRIGAPFDHQGYYTENIVHLPDCFLTSDGRMENLSNAPSREDVKLPADGFVFCCFNNSYKLGRPMFELWMRILAAVDRSVLWLAEWNGGMAANLRREAQRRGVDPGRLVFAPPVALSEHLARQQLAGLFLDTLPYNAGATATAALWSGIPLLTVIGRTLAGRMAASMLHAVGLPELVTQSLGDYENLAVKIATEPGYCAALKTRLAHNRETCPLFDTARFTRHLEAAYVQMWEAHQHGSAPASFAVKPSASP